MVLRIATAVAQHAPNSGDALTAPSMSSRSTKAKPRFSKYLDALSVSKYTLQTPLCLAFDRTASTKALPCPMRLELSSTATERSNALWPYNSRPAIPYQTPLSSVSITKFEQQFSTPTVGKPLALRK